MSKSIEIEAKGLLSKSDYDLLISVYDPTNTKRYTQINEYIDTPKRDLKKLHCGLRVRTKKNNKEITLKIRVDDKNIEITKQLKDEQTIDKLIEGEIKNKLKEMGFASFDDLSFVAKSKTIRLDINYKSSLLSIDHSYFPTSEDYEIESEDDDINKARSNLIEFLNNKKIPFKENHETKLSRTFKSLSTI